MAAVVRDDQMMAARRQFERDGYCMTPPLLPAQLLERVTPRMDALIRGEYETGVEPHARHFGPDDPPERLRKIDQPHLCDNTVRELVTHPAIGQWAAAITGAKMVQVFAVQQLVKPAGGRHFGHVGWHQDKAYWPYFEGQLLTAWVAVSDVTADSGPMRFVPGSHRWGLLDGSDFFGADLDALKKKINIPKGEAWAEVPAILPPGAVSFHHSHTFHGSGANNASYPRRSFALHLRTENARIVAPNYYVEHLDDPIHAPIIYQEEAQREVLPPMPH